MAKELEGRIALVTGASRGIGRACALALADASAAVALVGRAANDLADVEASVATRGVRAASFVCDVTDPATVAKLPALVHAALGSVDVLVNNAGAAESRPFAKADLEHWERMLRVNLTSAFLVTRAFLPGMLERGFGRVIQIASVAGKVGAPYVAAYTAAKHGVVGFTKALALEVAKKGVTVNAVCPGYVDTPMTDASVDNIVVRTGKSADDARSILARTNPQERLIEPEEIAATVLFLASAAARGINGQAINICGGATPL